MVMPDVFIDHDSPPAMYARAGLDANGIVAKVFEAFNFQSGAVTQQTASIVVTDRKKALRSADALPSSGSVKGG